MKKNICIFVFMSVLSNSTMNAQDSNFQDKNTSAFSNDFFKDVQFGGGLGLAIGNGFTNIGVSPSAIYNFTDKFAAGAGVQFNYLKSKGYYESTSYGLNVIGLYSPIPEFQLSAEIEQLRVNNEYNVFYPDGRMHSKVSDDFWNTGLFIGAGYRTDNVTVGVKYNVLYKESNLVYSQAWMPFVRVYF